MKNAGYRVAVIGASSLLGKELLAVLEERNFPVAELVTVSGEPGEPDLPIVDLSRRRRAVRGGSRHRRLVPERHPGVVSPVPNLPADPAVQSTARTSRALECEP